MATARVSEDIEATRFRGWLITTAEMAGLYVLEARHSNPTASSDPDILIFGIPDTPVLIVKPKTIKAAGGDNAKRGGFSEAQLRVAEAIRASGCEYVCWTPEHRLEAHERLTGHRNPSGTSDTAEKAS